MKRFASYCRFDYFSSSYSPSNTISAINISILHAMIPSIPMLCHVHDWILQNILLNIFIKGFFARDLTLRTDFDAVSMYNTLMRMAGLISYLISVLYFFRWRRKCDVSVKHKWAVLLCVFIFKQRLWEVLIFRIFIHTSHHLFFFTVMLCNVSSGRVWLNPAGGF